MKKIGIIVESEFSQLFEAMTKAGWDSRSKYDPANGAFLITRFTHKKNPQQVIICNGIRDEIAAAAATEFLIAAYHVEGVIDFSRAYPIIDTYNNQTVMLTSLKPYEESPEWIYSSFKLCGKGLAQAGEIAILVSCISNSKINATKMRAPEVGCVYDNIAAGIAMTAARHHLPWLSIKSVSNMSADCYNTDSNPIIQSGCKLLLQLLATLSPS